MSTSLLLAYAASVAFLVFQALRRSKELHVFPSVAWFSLMAAPFYLQHQNLHPRFLLSQTVGISAVSLALLLGDGFSVYKKQKLQTSALSTRTLSAFALALYGISLILQATHLYLMPKIPLLEAIKNDLTPAQISLLRENSGKLLNAPLGFLYLCHLSIVAFSPVAFIIFSKQKKYFLGFAVAFTTLIYSRAEMSWAHFLTFALLIGLATWVNLRSQWRKRFLIFGSTVAFFVAIPAAWFLLTHPHSIFIYKGTSSTQYQVVQVSPDLPIDAQPTTLPDHFRILLTDADANYANEHPFFVLVNRVTYRGFLVPSEVSHKWYQYFPLVRGSYLGFEGLTPSSRNRADFQHPSNEVGRWAYQARFPNQYGDSIHAYASADADAWARFGYVGLCMLLIALVAIRIGLSLINLPDGIGQAVQICAISLLAVGLPAAGLPTIFIVHGLFVYFLIYFFFLVAKLRHKEVGH